MLIELPMRQAGGKESTVLAWLACTVSCRGTASCRQAGTGKLQAQEAACLHVRLHVSPHDELAC